VREDQKIELKESWHDEYLKHICAFANSHGGSLYIGIKDDGSVVGVKNQKRLLEDIPNKVVQLLGISVNVETRIENEKEFLELQVQPSVVPISLHGKFYIRSGTTIQELHGHELREFILRKDNFTWDEITVPHAGVEDLDEKIIRRFISKASSQNRLYFDAINDDSVSILNKLDLIKEGYKLTRAAILLFGNRPKKYIGSATVKIGKFGNSSTELISHDIIEGDLLGMPDRIIDILRTKYLRAAISYEGLERKELLEYPEKALREAVLNAIVHRDYSENMILQYACTMTV